MALYTYGDGTLRLVDGTTPTPFYLEVKFVEASLRAPTGRPRPAERLVLDRGRLDAAAQYVRETDAAVAEPQELRFSALVDSEQAPFLLDALAVGTVNGHAWATTKGSSQLAAGDGSLVTTPAFADSLKKTVNVEVLWDLDADLGWRWAEVWFPPERVQVREGEGAVSVELAGLVYGAIARIGAFGAGNDTTA